VHWQRNIQFVNLLYIGIKQSARNVLFCPIEAAGGHPTSWLTPSRRVLKHKRLAAVTVQTGVAYLANRRWPLYGFVHLQMSLIAYTHTVTARGRLLRVGLGVGEPTAQGVCCRTPPLVSFSPGCVLFCWQVCCVWVARPSVAISHSCLCSFSPCTTVWVPPLIRLGMVSPPPSPRLPIAISRAAQSQVCLY